MAEQQMIPGTEPPHHNIDIERALAGWHEKKREQKLASAATRQAHATVVLHIQHAGLEAYPWINPDTGRKRNFRIAREPKVIEERAPSERSSRRGGVAEVGESVSEKRERKKRREEEKVEVRRVSRSTVENEVDPFAATRQAMENRVSSTKPAAKKKGKRK